MWIGEDHQKGKQNFNDFHMLTSETATTKPNIQTFSQIEKQFQYVSVHFGGKMFYR